MASGGAHTCQVNGILGLLCKEHFPGLVEYAGVTGPAYSFDQYTAVPDAADWVCRVFNNKAERVKQELWVSLPRTTLLNTSHSLDILEIMNGYIVFVCRISLDARTDMRPGRMRWLPNAAKNSSWTCVTRRHRNLPRDRPWNEGHQKGRKEHDADPGPVPAGKYRILILIPFEIK